MARTAAALPVRAPRARVARHAACAAIAAVTFATIALGGCSSKDGTGTGPSAQGTSSPAQAPAKSCVQKGEIGNSKGVGTYCTPRGGECLKLPQASVCLAEADPKDGQWFCTRFCTADEQCGEGAVCLEQHACVPSKCVGGAAGGSIGAPDAGTQKGGGGSPTGDAGAKDAGAEAGATGGPGK